MPPNERGEEPPEGAEHRGERVGPFATSTLLREHLANLGDLGEQRVDLGVEGLNAGGEQLVGHGYGPITLGSLR